MDSNELSLYTISLCFFLQKRRIYESIYTVIWKILGLHSFLPSQTPPHSSRANDWSQGAVDNEEGSKFL